VAVEEMEAEAMAPSATTGSLTIDMMMKRLLERFDFEYDWITLEACFAAPYQRKVTSLAKEIGENYLPPLVGTILLSERTGEGTSVYGPDGQPFAIIDGLQRVSGAALSENPVVTELPGLIYRGLTYQDEAAVFSLLQRKRRNMATVDRFDAAIHAQEPEALDMRRILRGHKVKVGPKKGKNTVQCVKELEVTYRHTDEHYPEPGVLLDRTFRVINSAWRPNNSEASPDLYRGDIVRGVARLLSNPGLKVDEDRLVTTLQRIDPLNIAMRATAKRSGNGGKGTVATYVVEVLLSEYKRR
jgi:hypothetical protein